MYNNQIPVLWDDWIILRLRYTVGPDMEISSKMDHVECLANDYILKVHKIPEQTPKKWGQYLA